MTYNIHITDSYKISKREFDDTLYKREYEAYGYNIESEIQVFEHRSYCSMKLEWATHNALYALGIQRERTRSVDLNYPQRLWEKMLYPICGCLVWIFIK